MEINRAPPAGLRKFAGLMVSDHELLHRYAHEASQPAFTELVQRHGHLAYRAALRRLAGDAHAAEDVVQKVFTDLARKAGQLGHHRNLAGWIHLSVRFAATDTIRREQRRRHREHQANMETDPTDVAARERLEPWLDELLDTLPDREREAVILHFLEGRSLVETGALLSISADAARMRVNRALERLRLYATRHGIKSSAAALGELLLTQSDAVAGAPSWPIVAHRALLDAARLGPIEASLLHRVATGLRAVSTTSWVASALIIGGALIAVPAWTRRDSPASPASQTEMSLDETHWTDEISIEEARPHPDSEAVATHSAIASANIVTAIPREPAFAKLGDAEKRILKVLWSRECEFGTITGRRWAVSVAPAEAKYREFVAARRALRLCGWVIVNRHGATILTEDGLAYCLEQRAAIDAFAMPKTRPRNPVPLD